MKIQFEERRTPERVPRLDLAGPPSMGGVAALPRPKQTLQPRAPQLQPRRAMKRFNQRV